MFIFVKKRLILGGTLNPISPLSNPPVIESVRGIRWVWAGVWLYSIVTYFP
ncbi:unnamed protein product [Brassica napus]|uniref:(rape) hypothetical protein n=1 Tax=Brassica napus TaxID=3708 RepID=A0A816QA13_BRANA|nr:unnamed protein product [Brassica napus]